ncbi:MAG: glycoside hydrolase [Burkholderiales bacterium]|nr:glycoside hydrolase [Burkholderiales bacterium]
MSETPRQLNLILCWHMHQPDYRNYANGEFVLPWTYLHAAKDYTDMAYHLEQNPQARAVVNFVPVLLDQLEDYARQFKTGEIRDPLLRLLAREDMGDLSSDERDLLLDRCFRCNHITMIDPYPPYRRLLKLFQEIDLHEDKHFEYLSGQYLADLVTWYHLIWVGESVRRNTELIPRLMSQGALFSYTDRRLLFELYGELIAGLIPRYRKLLEEGRIEVSTTPHYHPIAPLLIDLKSAREALPDSGLPETLAYPGGVERMVFHIDSAIASHEARFGRRPGGMWPAEGAVSQASLMLLAQHGVKWAATGEGVLVNSLRQSHGQVPEKAEYMYRPYRVHDATQQIHCFFRDDRLSDLIGFEYAKWYGRDAVANFVSELESIYRRTDPGENPVVSVILDGENAWEYYPYNGYYFLSELYEALTDHPHIRLTTFSEYLAECADKAAPCARVDDLPKVVTGSWVYGNLATWIGDHAKNRAWDLLCAAKQSYDLVMASERLSLQARADASRQLADCESSDWFWWFGDYNPSHSVAMFDALFRSNLKNLYQHLQLPIPVALDHPISQGGATSAEAGGTMRRGS